LVVRPSPAPHTRTPTTKGITMAESHAHPSTRDNPPACPPVSVHPKKRKAPNKKAVGREPTTSHPQSKKGRDDV
jgi:hypothetical protein